MSHSRKHITLNSLQNFPIPTTEEQIVRVVELRGSNVCEIEHTNGERILCTIPNKFHKLIWIKKGNYIIVRYPPELESLKNRKIKAIVMHILFPAQIKHLVKENLWPKEFVPEVNIDQPPVKEMESTNGEDLEGWYNPNQQILSDSSSSEEDSEED